jgi:hypothetical protein
MGTYPFTILRRVRLSRRAAATAGGAGAPSRWRKATATGAAPSTSRRPTPKTRGSSTCSGAWRSIPPGSLLQRVQSRGLGDRRHAGHLPIHLAATEMGKGPHQVDVIKVLAEACPESLGMPARDGSLPVHQALTSDVMPGVVQLLVSTLPESVPEATRLGLLRSAMWYADEARGSTAAPPPRQR